MSTRDERTRQLMERYEEYLQRKHGGKLRDIEWVLADDCGLYFMYALKDTEEGLMSIRASMTAHREPPA